MHYHVVRIDEEGEHVDPALTFDRQDEAEERAVAVAREIDGPGWSGPQAGGVRALAPIAQQVGDRLAARLLAQVAGVVLAPLLPAAERGVGPVRLRVEEEEPAAVEDQSTRLPPHPHGAQGAPGARPVSSDQGSTRRLTQRSATTKAAAVRIAIHASSAARPGVTVPLVSARHTFTAWARGW